MSKITVTGTVDAPREAVWELLTDPKRQPEYSEGVDEVVGDPPEELAAGVTYRDAGSLGPVRVETEWEVTAFAPPHRLIVHGNPAVVDVTQAYYLSETEDRRTRVKVVTVYELLPGIEGVGEVVDWAVFHRLFARNLVGTLERFRDLAEREHGPRRIPIE